MQCEAGVKEVCERIIQEFAPQKLFVFSVKRSVAGAARSFKVCVVAETARKNDLEKKIYLDIDSEIPYDVLVYTPGEWAGLLEEQHSFAQRILQEGTCVYGAETTQGRQ